MSNIKSDQAQRIGVLLTMMASSLGCRTDFVPPQPPDLARTDAQPLTIDAAAEPMRLDALADSPQTDPRSSDAAQSAQSFDAYVRPALPPAGPLRGLFRIVSHSAGDCWQLAEGNRLLRSPCGVDRDQLFRILPAGPSYRIVSSLTERCLHTTGDPGGNGLSSRICSDDPREKFGLSVGAEGRFRMTTDGPGQCLEAISAAGVITVRTSACNPVATQDWQLRRQFDTGPYQLAIKHTGKCLEVPNASVIDGVVLQEASCAENSSQLFTILERGPGVFQLVNRSSAKCVDVAYSGLTDGTPVHQWICNGTTAQFFRIESIEEYDRLVNINSGRCVQIGGSGILDGGQIEQSACTNDDRQLWELRLVSPRSDASPPPPPPDARFEPDVPVHAPVGSDAGTTVPTSGGIALCFSNPQLVAICRQLEPACENCPPGGAPPGNPTAQRCYDLVQRAKAGMATDLDCVKFFRDNRCTVDDGGNVCGSLNCSARGCDSAMCTAAYEGGRSAACMPFVASCPCR